MIRTKGLAGTGEKVGPLTNTHLNISTCDSSHISWFEHHNNRPLTYTLSQSWWVRIADRNHLSKVVSIKMSYMYERNDDAETKIDFFVSE